MQLDRACGPGDFRGLLARGEGPPSLYVHLPFCRSLCYYCGCHRIVTNRPERIAESVERLIQEIDLVKASVDRSRRVQQVHWGGGAPTYLAPDQSEDVMADVGRLFVRNLAMTFDAYLRPHAADRPVYSRTI